MCRAPSYSSNSRRGLRTGASGARDKSWSSPGRLPKAFSFDVHYGVEVNGVPPTWTTVTIPGSKKWIITDLTPGANYAFQIRALGRLGYTDWSASTHFICG